MGKSGTRYTFKHYEFWAADGRVAILDTQQAGGTQESVEEATKWCRPGEFLKNAMAAASIHSRFDRFEAKRLLDNALACAKEAHLQGDITDPKILRQRLDESRKVQIATTSMPRPVKLSAASPLLAPQPDPMTRRYLEEFRRLRERPLDPGDVLLNGYREHVRIVEGRE